MSKGINDSAYWREFEKNELTHSAAHYLMAIDSLREELGYARVTDVAKKLEVSRGAASMFISQLKERGWVKEDPNRFLLLTDRGEAVVNLVEHNFRIVSSFFTDFLKVEKDIAFADACKIEHLLSLETGKRLLGLMHFVDGNPKLRAQMEEFLESGKEQREDVEGCPICEGTMEPEPVEPAPAHRKPGARAAKR
jgi:Mn-dependent DtxR family transcriptional regulator